MTVMMELDDIRVVFNRPIEAPQIHLWNGSQRVERELEPEWCMLNHFESEDKVCPTLSGENLLEIIVPGMAK